ncbi:MAG: ABC transporter ATP-binding protein [Cytophagales bacterium]|nr:MAG: ABC transporter ATP-binding protein [Cytophagales bacterium]
MFKIQNLSKSYSLAINQGIKTSCELKPDSELDQIKAVENISFEIKRGEILGILGENGSGKSTLLKMLAGLLQPTNGKIILNKTEIGGPSTKLVAGHENIKLIHQSYNLFPNISLEENIKYHLRFYNEDYQKSRTTYLLELCHLEHLKHKLPRQASGGEQQRTAIACAVATPTDVLLLDEPFSNLDVFNSEILKNQIVKIVKKEKLYAVFVTHDAHDALSVSDKLAVIKDGKILSIQTPIDSYQKPENEYVAGITGLCNILKIRELNIFFDIQNENQKLKKCIIRPENIYINHKGISAIVKKCSFRGDRFLLEILVGKISLILFSHKAFIPDSEVFITIDKEKIWFI